MTPRTTLSILAGLLCASCVGQAEVTSTEPTTAPVHSESTAQPQPPVAPETAPASEGNASIVCQGSDDMLIENRNINVPGDGITVVGSCTVTLVDSQILAQGWGLVVQGSGDIIVRNSSVNGQAGAFSISGSGDIQAVGSTFVGAMQISGTGDLTASNSNFTGKRTISGSGDYNDGGGNTWTK